MHAGLVLPTVMVGFYFHVSLQVAHVEVDVKRALIDRQGGPRSLKKLFLNFTDQKNALASSEMKNLFWACANFFPIKSKCKK